MTGGRVFDLWVSDQSVSHHPHLLSASRLGAWCSCPCGWSSGHWTTVVGAHLEFGEHLVAASRVRQVGA